MQQEERRRYLIGVLLRERGDDSPDAIPPEEEQQWRLDFCAGAQRKAVLTQPYSQTKGETLGLMINAIEHAELRTPEGREKLTNKIFDQYVCFFPDYCRTGPNEFALKAE